jgi:aminopeptidase-like protein
MLTMKKPRKTSAKPQEDEKRFTSVQLNTNIDPLIRAAVDAYIESHNQTDEHQATVRSTTEAAFKMYLRSKGFWPPPQSKSS